VKQTWAAAGLEDTMLSLLQCNSPKEMLHHMLHLDKQKMIRCVAMLWTWWKHRNKINAREGKLNVEEVVFNTTRCDAEYEEFCVKSMVEGDNEAMLGSS
jgi:hypothetical protein